MDNNSNNFPFNDEPQKPFTEKQIDENIEMIPSCSADEIEEQPIENEHTEEVAQPDTVADAAENSHTVDYSHYSQNYYGYNNPQPQQGGYNGYVQPPYQQPYYGNNQPFAQPPKKKVSVGAVVLIVALCILIAGGFVGLIYNASKNPSANKGNAISSYEDFTLPRKEEATTPQTYFNESDYSSKIDKDFKGISLKSKPKDKENKKYTVGSAISKASNSVVYIVCYDDEAREPENVKAQGSGIILTADGFVVTNSHVINNSKSEYLIDVVTADGTTYRAGVVGYDSRTDIAVLKMDNAKNLKSATFGNSDEIEIGEDIVAVGNPGGIDYQNSNTKGIVSGVNRKVSSTSIVKYIQTDAAINPGNSGGPIINIYGQVIGIATSKVVADMYEGMGFAIPSTTVKKIADDLIKNSYVTGRVKIGIVGAAVTSKSEIYGLPKGILVSEVAKNGPCDGIGLTKNDVIVELDGKTVTSFADVYDILENHKANDKVKIKYYDFSESKDKEATITLQKDE